MPNYKNGKIYKFYSIKNPNKIYIGQTTHTLKERFYQHKNLKANNCLSRQIVEEYGADSCVIELLQLAPCENIKELKAIEDMWIRCDRDYTIINNVNRPAQEKRFTVDQPYTKKRQKEVEKLHRQSQKDLIRLEYEEHLQVLDNYENQKLRTVFYVKRTGEIKLILYLGHKDDLGAKREYWNPHNRDKQLIYINPARKTLI